MTAMVFMFTGASTPNQLIGDWSSAAVTTMRSMCYGASKFNQTIGVWNTAAVTTMVFVFIGASTCVDPGRVPTLRVGVDDWYRSGLGRESFAYGPPSTRATRSRTPPTTWTLRDAT